MSVRKPGPSKPMVIEQLLARMARSPDSVALEYGTQRLSYPELDRAVCALALQLRELGVKVEARVGICCERGPAMVIAILAVLRAGGAYVPLDPTYPGDRLRYFVEDSQLSVILCTPGTRAAASSLAGQGMPLVAVELRRLLETGTKLPPLPAPAPESLAYLIYTSGSTGKPKGVQIEHRNLSAFVESWAGILGLGASTRCLQFAAVNFDASVLEIFPVLCHGGTLVLADKDQLVPGSTLENLIRDQRVNTALLPPSVLAMMEPTAVPALSCLVSGGEALPGALAARWCQARTLFNAYGPTEVTVVATATAVRSQGENPTIGRPLPHARVYVVDERGQRIVPGQPGELWIGGAGVARGYHALPELTREKFLPDPFVSIDGARVYRSGDRVRQLPDGQLEFLGRLDSQVKIRGFRIELGELEAVLGACPQVLQAVAVARGEGSERHLVAYVVPERSPPSARALREHLAKSLPDYMVPSQFIFMDALPLSDSGGKVDRERLPLVGARETGSERPSDLDEGRMADLWAKILGCEQVGSSDDFFELGGHSLLAAKLVAEIRRQLGWQARITHVFAHPTVHGLTSALKRDSGERPGFPPLRRVSREKLLPASLPQERVCLIQQLDPSNRAYQVQMRLTLRGKLHREALKRSLAAIIRRHEIFRTTFLLEDGRAFQRVHPSAELPLREVDLQPAGSPTLAAVTDEEIERPFSIGALPLVRWTLIQTAPEEHHLLIVEHHLVHDGLSFNVFLDELGKLYAAELRGENAELEEPLQFADYASWDREWAQSAEVEKQIAFYRDMLQELPGPLELPFDRPRPAVLSARGGLVRVGVAEGQAQKVHDYCKATGATPFLVYLSAFLSYLHRVTRRTDFCVGTTVGNRPLPEMARMIGMAVNSLVLRSHVEPQRNFQEQLQQTRGLLAEVLANGEAPFERVVRAVQATRSLALLPLAQVFCSQHISPEVTLPGLACELELPLSNRSAKFDLGLTLICQAAKSGQIAPRWLAWEYNSDLFDAATVRALAERFDLFVGALLEDPQRPIGELSLITEEEARTVTVQWNRSPVHASLPGLVHQQVAQQAARTPEAVAVRFGEQSLTYRELEIRSNQLAQLLARTGCGPESRVAIHQRRGLDLAVSMLAVLKAGAAYVPLDPGYPSEWRKHVLGDCGATLVLTSSDDVEPLRAMGLTVLAVDQERGRCAEQPTQAPTPALGGENLAYVIYTSGSTGTPKGAMLTHANLMNHMEWFLREYSLGPEDRVLQKTPVAFDASVWEFWAPLMAGARLQLAPDDAHQDPAQLVELLEREQITVVQVVPTLLQLLLEQPRLGQCRSLRRIFCGGEALPRQTLDRSHEVLSCEIINLYGPTETTIDATAWRSEPGRPGPVLIGRPISNVRAYVLDAGLKPLPAGITGELFIAGAGVGRGYVGKPALTAERFLPDPWGPPGSRMYRTGDLARWTADGSLEYLGRTDFQIKLRGFRIELGEIEAALARISGVRLAVAGVRRDAANEERLVGYWVPSDPENPPSNASIKDALGAKLPYYMVPAALVRLEALPVTANGKLDREKLPAPKWEETSSGEFVGPRNELEATLLGIWRTVLKLKEIGVHDSFFELGGDSLHAIQVVARARDEGLPLRPGLIFQHGTVAQLAEHLQREMGVGLLRR